MTHSPRYYRQGVKARQEKRQPYECKYERCSVRYDAWIQGWRDENDRILGDSEGLTRFTDTKAAIDEAQYLAEQNGYAYSICADSEDNLVVIPKFKTGLIRAEELETIHPLAKFSGNGG